MDIRNIATGDIGDHIKLFPNTSFPNGIPTNDWLAENGYEIVIYEAPPIDPLILTERNIASLWRSATNYQESFISGAAIGLLTIGVIQQKPKSIEIMQWIQLIWNTYYSQKSIVDENYPGFDFSICGPMPYSVPELQLEVLS